MDKLLELAERCEKAAGADRALDIEIVVAIDWRDDDWEEGERTAREMAEKHGLEWLTSRSVEGYSSFWRHLPRFTASLDAAMTLVPEGQDALIRELVEALEALLEYAAGFDREGLPVFEQSTAALTRAKASQ